MILRTSLARDEATASKESMEAKLEEMTKKLNRGKPCLAQLFLFHECPSSFLMKSFYPVYFLFTRGLSLADRSQFALGRT